jgi:DNA-binding transcriptional LysR family regulator
LRFDWNDLRFLAAVLEHGSTARAARAVGVDQTTCARRIAALEQALGLELFTRDAAGYHPTAAARVLEPAAMAVAREVDRFARQVEAEARRTTRRLRITCEEYLARAYLVPALSRFAAAHPHVQVEVESTLALRDLTAGEADLAIRAGSAPDDPGVIRRKLRDDPWGVYCSAAYARARGAPRDMAEVAGHPLALMEAAVPGARAAGLEGSIRQVLTAAAAAQAAISTGAYIGPLPGSVADNAPDLVLCFPLPQVAAALWLIYPERLRRVPEVRALAQTIAGAFRRAPDATAS